MQDEPRSSASDGIAGIIGRPLGGYLPTRLVARGGMGIVYEATQASLNRSVAIKVLYPQLAADETFRERFRREALAVARLTHPHIARVFDYGEDPLYYLVMDYVRGDSLRELLARVHGAGQTFALARTLEILEQVGSAIDYAHRQNYVHRDIKPGNILLDLDGQAYLVDFGVAKLAGDSDVTMTGQIIGTPQYMAPEQGSGAADIGPPADLYALAVVAYEMLVGRVPFAGNTPLAVMQMHIANPPPPPSSFLSDFPATLEAVLLRALAKQPSERFASAQAFVTQLRAADAQRVLPASATPLTEPPPAPSTPTPASVAAPSAAQPLAVVASAPATPTGVPPVATSTTTPTATPVATPHSTAPAYRPPAQSIARPQTGPFATAEARRRRSCAPVLLVLILLAALVAAGVWAYQDGRLDQYIGNPTPTHAAGGG